MSGTGHFVQPPSKFRRYRVGCLNTSVPSRERVTTNILTLPDDLLLLIVSFVEVKDILVLRKTCKRCFTITKLRWVWHDAMKRHVIDRGLPVPAADADLKAFGAEHLESRAVHAAMFHDNWCSSSPKVKRSIAFYAEQDLPDELPEARKTTVSHVAFLPRCGGQLVVTVVGRVITCWEVPLDGSGAYRVADYASASPVDGLITNKVFNKAACLAYSTTIGSQPDGPATIVALTLDRFHGQFVGSSMLRGSRSMLYPLHAMYGDYIILGNAPTVWFFTHPVVATSMGWSLPPLGVTFGKVRAVEVIKQYTIIVRENFLQIDHAPVWKDERTVYGRSCTTVAQLPILALEAIVIHRDTITDEREKADRSEPVTILMRGHLDGVDSIIQLDLFLGVDVLDCDVEPDPVGMGLPRGVARWVRSDPVPPSCKRLCVGSSGKGFYSMTRNITSKHISYPVRSLMGFHVTRRRGTVLSSERKPGEGKKQLAVDAGNDVHFATEPLYSRRCHMTEIIHKKYSMVSTAFEDAVGRVAIGDRMGKVEVLDFA